MPNLIWTWNRAVCWPNNHGHCLDCCCSCRCLCCTLSVARPGCETHCISFKCNVTAASSRVTALLPASHSYTRLAVRSSVWPEPCSVVTSGLPAKLSASVIYACWLIDPALSTTLHSWSGATKRCMHIVDSVFLCEPLVMRHKSAAIEVLPNNLIGD